MIVRRGVSSVQSPRLFTDSVCVSISVDVAWKVQLEVSL